MTLARLQLKLNEVLVGQTVRIYLDYISKYKQITSFTVDSLELEKDVFIAYGSNKVEFIDGFKDIQFDGDCVVFTYWDDSKTIYQIAQ